MNAGTVSGPDDMASAKRTPARKRAKIVPQKPGSLRRNNFAAPSVYRTADTVPRRHF